MISLDNVKRRLGIPLLDISEDEKLKIAIEDAKEFFCNYTRRKIVPDRASGLVERLVTEAYRRPAGITSESVGDTSITYSTDNLSDELRTELNRYRRIGVG